MGVKLHRLSSLIVIPSSLQANFSFYHIVEGTNQTAAVWWSPFSGTLGSPHKKSKNEWFCFLCLFIFVKKLISSLKKPVFLGAENPLGSSWSTMAPEVLTLGAESS